MQSHTAADPYWRDDRHSLSMKRWMMGHFMSDRDPPVGPGGNTDDSAEANRGRLGERCLFRGRRDRSPCGQLSAAAARGELGRAVRTVGALFASRCSRRRNDRTPLAGEGCRRNLAFMGLMLTTSDQGS